VERYNRNDPYSQGDIHVNDGAKVKVNGKEQGSVESMK
jgi:hypothetical protein